MLLFNSVLVVLRCVIIACMQWELTKTQRVRILAALADVDWRTVENHLNGKDIDGKPGQARKRERIELAKQKWSQIETDHEEACERRKLASVDSTDTTKGTDNDAQ